jgi:hypothetical protein
MNQPCPLVGTIFTLLTAMHGSGTSVTQASPEALVMGLQGTFRLAALMLTIAAIILLMRWRSPKGFTASQP